jgi:ZIP family zinc transporter
MTTAIPHGGTTIEKDPSRLKVRPHLGDYEDACAGFSWAARATVGAGVACGALFLAAVRRGLREHEPRGGLLWSAGGRRAALVILVLFVHSLPEGFAIGSAWASGTAGLGAFVLVAIAVQNVPEGTATAIPLAIAGVGRAGQVGAAIATSLPQPLGAVLAFLLVDQIRALLPFSFGFAAGAMLALVIADVAPDAWRSGGRGRASAGALAGGALMVAVAVWCPAPMCEATPSSRLVSDPGIAKRRW